MPSGVVVGNSPDKKDKVLLFYGRSPVFSNFYCSPFHLDGCQWLNSEQYFQHYKALYFRDENTQKAILQASTPDEHKRLGRKVVNYQESQWSEIREDVMLKATIAKFRQNSNLRAQLFETIGMKLAEASPWDRIWGIGIPLNDPKGFDEKQWKGSNLLGTVIMKARDYLQQEFEQETKESNNV